MHSINYLRRLLPLMIIAIVASMSMTSCDNDDYYYSPITGSWELVEIDGYPVYESDVVEFEFYPDGSGYYSQYDAYGRWTSSPITWDTSMASGGAMYLDIYTYDGQIWQYLMYNYSRSLELIDLSTGQQLLFEKY